ncbi:hypothetical protein RXV88_11745 [Aestuariicoccus sp. MJ-SS9]|nr:hypothetical protein [Aestuariicoccus sp. MJ-SS9]
MIFGSVCIKIHHSVHGLREAAPMAVVSTGRAVTLNVYRPIGGVFMDAFFVLPIFILLVLLGWCVLQLKDDL